MANKHKNHTKINKSAIENPSEAYKNQDQISSSLCSNKRKTTSIIRLSKKRQKVQHSDTAQDFNWDYISQSDSSSDSSLSIGPSKFSMQDPLESCRTKKERNRGDSQDQGGNRFELDYSSESSQFLEDSFSNDQTNILEAVRHDSDRFSTLLSNREYQSSSNNKFKASYDNFTFAENSFNIASEFPLSSCLISPNQNLNNKILHLQQLTSISDKFGQLSTLQEINQYFLLGYDENMVGINFRGLVTCILNIVDDSSSDGSFNIDSFCDENTLVELKSIGIALLIHLIELMPRAVGDLLAPAIPLLLGIIRNCFVVDILERMLSLLEHLSKDYPKHIIRCKGLKTIINFYDFVTVSQHRTILNLINNCFIQITVEDLTDVSECIPQLVSRLRDPEPRCVEKVCQCFLKLVTRFQNHAQIIELITESDGFLNNVEFLLLSSPPILPNNLDLIQILTLMCKSNPNLAVKLVKNKFSQTITNFIAEISHESLNKSNDTEASLSGDFSKSKSDHSIIQEELYSIINLISQLMPPQCHDWETIVNEGTADRTSGEYSSNSYNLRSNTMDENVSVSSSSSKSRQKSKKRSCSQSSKGGQEKNTLEPRFEYYENEIKKFERCDRNEMNNQDQVLLSIDSFLSILLKIYSKCEDDRNRLKCLNTIYEVLFPLKTKSLSIVVKRNLPLYTNLANILVSSYNELIINHWKACYNNVQLFLSTIRIIDLLVDKLKTISSALHMRKQGIIFLVRKIMSNEDFICFIAKNLNFDPVKDSLQITTNNSFKISLNEGESSKVQLRRKQILKHEERFTEKSSLVKNLDDSQDMHRPKRDEKKSLVREKSQEWLRKKCSDIDEKLSQIIDKVCKVSQDSCQDLLPKLSEIARKMNSTLPIKWKEAITEMVSMFSVKSNDQSSIEMLLPSPFELEHSGFLTAFLNYLSNDEENGYSNRLRILRDGFAPELNSITLPKFLTSRICNCQNVYNYKYDPCELCQCQIDYINLNKDLYDANSNVQSNELTLGANHKLANFISCLLNCLHQHEHFPVFTGTDYLLSSGHSNETNSKHILTAANHVQFNPNINNPHHPMRLETSNFLLGNTIGQLASKTNALSNSPLSIMGGMLKLELSRDKNPNPEVEKLITKNNYWNSLNHPISMKVLATLNFEKLEKLLIQRAYLINYNHTMMPSGSISFEKRHMAPAFNYAMPSSFSSDIPFTIFSQDLNPPNSDLVNNNQESATPNQHSPSPSYPRTFKSLMAKSRSCRSNGSNDLVSGSSLVNEKKKMVTNFSNRYNKNKVTEDKYEKKPDFQSITSRRHPTSASNYPYYNMRMLRSSYSQNCPSSYSSTSVAQEIDETNTESISSHVPSRQNPNDPRQVSSFISFENKELVSSPENNPDLKDKILPASPRKSKGISLLAAINKLSGHVSQPSSSDRIHRETEADNTGQRPRKSKPLKSQATIEHDDYQIVNVKKNRRVVSKKAFSSMMNNKLVPVFYIDGARIDKEISIFQAIRSKMHSHISDKEIGQSPSDMLNTHMWSKSHAITYQLELKEENGKMFQKKNKTKHETTSKKKLKSPKVNHQTGDEADISSAMNSFMLYKSNDKREQEVLNNLGSFEYKEGVEKTVISILKHLKEFTENWGNIDGNLAINPLTNRSVFQSTILTSKVAQQLSDIFALLTCNWPLWIFQFMCNFSFLFNFSIRQEFFYSFNFNRDRLLMRLKDTHNVAEYQSPSLNHGNGYAFRNTVVLSSLRENSITQFLNQNSLKTLEYNLITQNLNSVTTFSGYTTSKQPNERSSFYEGHSSSSSRFSQFANSVFGIQSGNISDSTNTISTSEENPISPPVIRTELLNGGKKFKSIVSRTNLLEHAIETFEKMNNLDSILEIAFDKEAGFGIGPTFEFYTLVSHELQLFSLNLWYGHEADAQSFYKTPTHGFFPKPITSKEDGGILKYFTLIGRLLARSLLDNRQIDLPLSPIVYKWFSHCNKTTHPSLHVQDIEFIDSNLSRQLYFLIEIANKRNMIQSNISNNHKPIKSKDKPIFNNMKELHDLDSSIEDLCLSFVIPGYEYEIIENGSKVNVTGENISTFIEKIRENLLIKGVERQMRAMNAGFDEILPNSRVILSKLFHPTEMESLFCGQSMESWQIIDLMNSCKFDHGYTVQSKSIQRLFEIMSEFTAVERRLFIQFITGCPRLPIGGFKGLQPPLKIVRKHEGKDDVDNHLPSVMTCQNYLKLPDYSSKEIMKEKILYAINEGQNAFLLS